MCKTRLLGHPQPQIYPPVTLNQYTLVNRIYIYASRPHKQFKIDFTPKLSSPQHVKYGSNLMNIFFHFFFIFWGSLGKRIVNPEVLKCHEDLITLETYVQQGKTMDTKFFICENINIFGYLGAQGGGASIIGLGPSWFTSTLSLIIIYMSNIEAI